MWILVFMFAGGAVGAIFEKRKLDREDAQGRADRERYHEEELQALREGATLREARLGEFLDNKAERGGKKLP